MMIYELHGLNDVALDTCVRFRDRLSSKIDIEEAVCLLADPMCRGISETERREPETEMRREEGGSSETELRQQLNYVLHSKSWKMTAPMRALRSLF
jgi:hypothetical protein